MEINVDCISVLKCIMGYNTSIDYVTPVISAQYVGVQQKRIRKISFDDPGRLSQVPISLGDPPGTNAVEIFSDLRTHVSHYNVECHSQCRAKHY